MAKEVIPLHRRLEKAEPSDPRALARARVCQSLDEQVRAGHSLAAAIRNIRSHSGDLPTANTLRRWYELWRRDGAGALADKRCGRQRKPYGWEARAVALWNGPNRPSRATVAYWLRAEGWACASSSRVSRYLQSLPASVGGENTRQRCGDNHYRQNFTPYVARDESQVDVGLIYQGDGHNCDVYIQHPRSGRHWRPELTIWLDIRTHFCAGWWLSEAESAVSTLYGLSKALVTHDHVPACLHVDPGSGFINRLMTDEAVGWLAQVGIDVIEALPGNARGKGLIEGWFGWFEERLGKQYNSYCGHGRTDDDLRRLQHSLRVGKITLPTLADYARAVGAYVDSYNQTVQPRLDAAPAELWNRLERSPVELPEAVLLRPTEERIVRRGGITMFGRIYRSPQLHLVEGLSVQVEYDLSDDAEVWVNYRGGRVCKAAVVHRRPWASESRIEDLRKKRLAGRKKRLQRRLTEVEAQERPVIDGQAIPQLDLPDQPVGNPDIPFNPYDCLPEGEDDE